MNARVKKIASYFIKVLIAGVILWFIYREIDNETFREDVSKVSFGTVFLAAIVFALSKFFSSVRLTYFIREMGFEISQWQNWKLYLQGMFYNLFLPGGIGGDAYKIYYLNKAFL